MPRATTAELEAGLRARLSSSLPLDARCRLAINSLTSPLPVPGKQELVLAWLLAGLEQKYQADNTDQEVEGQTLLWTAVQTALPALQCLPAGAAQTVPDSLLDLVAVADLTRPEVGGAVHGLVELAASLVPLQPAWPALLTCLATRAPPSTHPALTGALPRVLPGLTPSDCAPLIAAVSHLPAHPAITAAAAQLLFNNLDPLPVTFSLLAGQVEGKGGGLLVSTLTAGCRPELLLAACPATPAWLPAKLVSLLVSCQGGPGMLDQDSLAGAELLAGIKQHLQQQEQAVPLAVLLQPVLPLDLSLELRPGLTVAAWLSAALGWAAGREDAEQLGRTVELLHTHHPHLLEPQLGVLLTRHLSSPHPTPLFAILLDLMSKLRQLPKLVSRLFLHLRQGPVWPAPLAWQQEDLSLLGTAMATAPRIQALELWKGLNYHLAADLLAGDRADLLAPVLGPLLSTLLLNAQLADHNLPSSLVGRIQDLHHTTVLHIDTLISRDELSAPLKSLVYEVSFAMSQLSDLLVSFRGLDKFSEVSQFMDKLKARMGESKPNCKAGRKLLLRFARQPEGSLSRLPLCLAGDLRAECELEPDLIPRLSDETLLALVRDSEISPDSLLLDNPRVITAILFSLLTSVNKEERLRIPGLDQWQEIQSLDSYVGRTLAQCFPTLMFSQIPFGRLPSEKLSLLSFLPLENLPAVLKLAATLLSVSQLLVPPPRPAPQTLVLTARCLDTTDLFRYVDAAQFLHKVVEAELDQPEELLEVAARAVGQYTKPITDINLNFNSWPEDDLHLKTAVFLLQAVSKTLLDGYEGSDKKKASKALVDNVSTYLLKVHDGLNLDEGSRAEVLCSGAAEIVKIFCRQDGLGRMSGFVLAMVEFSCRQSLPSCNGLLTEVCLQLDSFDSSSLPSGWRQTALSRLASSFSPGGEGLLRALVCTAGPEELQLLLASLCQAGQLHLHLWRSIISCEVRQDCQAAKRAGVEGALREICVAATGPDYLQLEQLPSLLTAVFSSSPPCVSPHTELTGLATLFLVPAAAAPASLSALSTFLSHRAKLSTRCVPITLALLRHCTEEQPSQQSLMELQKVLGLFSRHKADYSSVLPWLLADLLHLLHSLPAQDRGLLTTALYPLLDMTEKHHITFLSSSLPAATNELFKLILTNYNANHKFKGKV